MLFSMTWHGDAFLEKKLVREGLLVGDDVVASKALNARSHELTDFSRLPKKRRCMEQQET